VSEALSARAWTALRDVRDPEWPVSVVDLGLVRGIDVADGVARVRLTPTSTACPCLDWITADVRRRLLAEPGIARVEVEVVWERWSPADMSEAARAAFRRWGTSP
jgi:metal-sulfur cluster biosynthetic enzyme